jgi:hypothetical protein
MIALALYLNGLRKMTQVGGFITKAKRAVAVYENLWKDWMAEANASALRNNFNPLYAPEEGLALFRTRIAASDVKKIQEEAFGEAKLSKEVFEVLLEGLGDEMILHWDEVNDMKYYIRLTVRNTEQKVKGGVQIPSKNVLCSILRPARARMHDPKVLNKAPKESCGLSEI